MTSLRWKIGLLFFVGYTILFVMLTLTSIGGHMAHGDMYGSQRVELPSSLVTVDYLLFTIGFPVSSAVEWLNTKMNVRLPIIYQILLFLANGMVLSYLASHVYARFNKSA